MGYVLEINISEVHSCALAVRRMMSLLSTYDEDNVFSGLFFSSRDSCQPFNEAMGHIYRLARQALDLTIIYLGDPELQDLKAQPMDVSGNLNLSVIKSIIRACKTALKRVDDLYEQSVLGEVELEDGDADAFSAYALTMHQYCDKVCDFLTEALDQDASSKK